MVGGASSFLFFSSFLCVLVCYLFVCFCLLFWGVVLFCLLVCFALLFLFVSAMTTCF